MSVNIKAQTAAESYLAFANGGRTVKRDVTLVCTFKKHNNKGGKATQEEFINYAFSFGISPATNKGMGKLNHAILEELSK